MARCARWRIFPRWFYVIVHNRSLPAAPGDTCALLARHDAESDCVIHLAGLGDGAHATKPFPDTAELQGMIRVIASEFGNASIQRSTFSDPERALTRAAE